MNTKARINGEVVDVVQHINPDGSLGPCYAKDSRMRIGQNNTIIAHCALAHDVIIGDNNIIDLPFIDVCTVIGNNCVFEPGVKISWGTVIGDNVLIKQQSYIHDDCKIGNNVKIGWKCDIDDFTLIGDNCEIGHHVKIGRNQVIPPGTIIGEFEKIGVD